MYQPLVYSASLNYQSSLSFDLLSTMKPTEILEKLFGSATTVRVMRFFLTNPDIALESRDIAERLQLKSEDLRKVTTLLEKTTFLKKKPTPGKKTSSWYLAKSFPFLKEFSSMIVLRPELVGEELEDRLQKVGVPKLMVLSGLFTETVESKIDVLIVMQKEEAKKIEKVMDQFEAWLGRDVRYAAFSAKDFQYRFSLNDRLLRDVFDHNHSIVLERSGVWGKTETRR